MKTLYLITGSCPATEADVRLQMADIHEAEGRLAEAEEYREIVARMREEWADRSPAGDARRKLSAKPPGPDPEALVTPIATPERPMFWHEPRRDDTVVCPCGHFAEFLCDEPVGNGKTCDRPACKCCRASVGDYDQCDFHRRIQPRPDLTVESPTPTRYGPLRSV